MTGGGGSQSNGGPRGRNSNANGRPRSSSASRALLSASRVNPSRSTASNGPRAASNAAGNGRHHSTSASRSLSRVLRKLVKDVRTIWWEMEHPEFKMTNAKLMTLCKYKKKKGPVSKGGDGKMPTSKGELESYWQRIKDRPSPQVSPSNSDDELSIRDGEIAHDLSDEEEMEKGSVGEEEMEDGSVGEVEDEEIGELMFGGDESGGEEDWDDGSDESDGGE